MTQSRITIFLSGLLLLAGVATAEEPLGIALEGFPYPHPVSYFDLEIQGTQQRMAYMDVAAEVDTPLGTVLLLHGKNFCGAYWGPLIDDLAAAGYRVVVPDQIGFGKSTKPHTLQYSFHLLAQNTRALLDELGVNDTVVLGHSMGGMVATRFALMYPDRTRALVLTNPIGLEDWKQWVPYQSVDAWYANELKKTRAGIEQYQRESYYHGTWKPEYDRWADLQYRWTLSPEYPVIAWNSALAFDMIFTQPVVHEFDRVAAPTLLIIGQLDRTALGKNLVSETVRAQLGDYPALGRKAAARIPGAQLVELEGVGHIPHIEAYDETWAALSKFLEELADGSTQP